MRPSAAVVLLVAVVALSLVGSVRGSSSSSTGGALSAVGSVVLTSVSSSAFPPRSRASCAVDLSLSQPNASAAVYVLGGFNGASAQRELFNDVWRSTAFSFTTGPPPFVAINQSSAAPFPASSGGGAAVLANGAIVQFGGQDGVAGNDVFASLDGGASWFQVALNADWSSRTAFASCALPATNIVMIAAGLLSTNAPSPQFNSTDVWISQVSNHRHTTQHQPVHGCTALFKRTVPPPAGTHSAVTGLLTLSRAGGCGSDRTAWARRGVR